MKFKFFAFLCLFSIIFGQQTTAQSAFEEIAANRRLSAANYLAYPEPIGVKYTAAPKGYKPFYISHYARHGSRWLIGEWEYKQAVDILRKGAEDGKLTAEGLRVLAICDSVYRMSSGRLGELTPLGARQHRGIGRRMTQNFPEIFKYKNLHVDARSTVVIRCILSMMNECLSVQEANPSAVIKTDASHHDMYYMNYESDKYLQSFRKSDSISSVRRKSWNTHFHPERLMSVLYNDTAYVNQNVKQADLMSRLFAIASNMQSLDTDLELYSLFTTQECYDLWAESNLNWYIYYGNCELSQHMMPYFEASLLNNLLQTADSCLKLSEPSATLRFGHEVVVLPLTALLELDGYGKTYTDYEHLDDVWRNYRIFPMACNIQMIFYRKKGSDDILVKTMLNEHEVTMPVATDKAPYYHWKDLRAYYQKKLDTAREKKCVVR
ncbi:MAG: histidine acid phosphatase [Bacteroidaceae bacterium]|nr:histidine acid phosphatase [Bacteroidaceae bacterium]